MFLNKLVLVQANANAKTSSRTLSSLTGKLPVVKPKPVLLHQYPSVAAGKVEI